MKRLISSAIAAVLLGATASAFAYDGFATDNVNLRAGPDIDYPVVTVIPPGAPLDIQGCTDGYEWCDVIFDDARGWVAGSYIQYEYNDQPVLLSGYGARIGVPIVSFVIGDYWGSYYRNRPFWGDRDRWYSRPYFHHPAPVYRGAFHDWGHDRGHYDGGYDRGRDGGYGHGYAGHAPEYHGNNSHGAPEYRGNARGGPEYNGGSHGNHAPQQYNAQQGNAYQQHNAGQTHGYPQQNVQQNHGYPQQQNVQQNRGYPQQQNVQQNHGYPQQQNVQQNHAYQQQQQQVQHGGGQQYRQQGAAPQAQAAQSAPQHGEGHSRDKDNKDHDRGHR